MPLAKPLAPGLTSPVLWQVHRSTANRPLLGDVNATNGLQRNATRLHSFSYRRSTSLSFLLSLLWSVLQWGRNGTTYSKYTILRKQTKWGVTSVYSGYVYEYKWLVAWRPFPTRAQHPSMIHICLGRSLRFQSMSASTLWAELNLSPAWRAFFQRRLKCRWRWVRVGFNMYSVGRGARCVLLLLCALGLSSGVTQPVRSFTGRISSSKTIYNVVLLISETKFPQLSLQQLPEILST